MTLLVVGGQRVDAGKTTFSAGLLARTGAVGFKPRAGNDRWFDQDDVARALSDGRLYGKDARKLVAASPGSLEPEAVNPVHRLWQPAPGPGTGLLGQDDREFVVDRVEDAWIRNGTVDLPAQVRDALPVTDAEVPVVTSVDELNAVTQQFHLPAMERIADRVSTTDRAVVESYGDVARPYTAIEPAGVAVVDPGRARLYDGERFRKACAVATGSPQDGQLEERVGGVTDLVDPAATIDLSPLETERRHRPDAVADAYSEAYDHLLDLADWPA